MLTGARQVGKSTMLREVYGGISYISLNRPLVRESARENPSLFFEANKPPVIVDAIQKAAELFEYIKDIDGKGVWPAGKRAGQSAGERRGVCMAREWLPLTSDVWMWPVGRV